MQPKDQEYPLVLLIKYCVTEDEALGPKLEFSILNQ